ncbi:hypothetical protein C3D80_19670 [Cronobacter sakazakii]|uniref:hypothetical protein n=1 Tax=Cronobacter sakazakii TaxID=28141 RepID=UPI0009B9C936|nr:hypothetical protein [Cronobacter sakazakii]MDK1224581.1 hypothetical protein [Cronobacter turicensis]EJJ0671509.1 hypothetical protein [Cronobacter sakazakii]EMC4401922.1 hypothetical protein [Cronobacter sakazakii]KAB0805740.1 hypothetical protein FZI15_22060 [Cronobacter sakazakii]KAB0887808.1 hypothetical protein FZI07_20730 [Cronobacter sakazakii]
MAKHRTPVQFRLEESLYNTLKAEANARALSPNEYAQKLMTQILLTDLKATERNSTNLRLSATTTFTLLALAPFILRQFRPELTQEEILGIVEDDVFKVSRERVDTLMRNLGLEG